jgi:acyl carrier protein
METASPATVSDDGALRYEVNAAVKEIIASIKMIDEGADAIPEDAQLFNDGLSEPSPLELDSLDALDLALALKERFDPEGERFEAFLNGDVDLQSLGTVRKITDYVLSLGMESMNGHDARVDMADERVPAGY